MISSAVRIYTDGSCSPNPGPGGWGAVLLFGKGNKVVELQGAVEQATNNRMELLAALNALQSLKESSEIILTTDSKYLQQGINQWLSRWQENGWKTRDGNDVKNRDLWESFVDQLAKHRIEWHWVKGHGSERWNVRADELAVSARKGLPGKSETADPLRVHLYPGVTWKNSTGAGAWAVILRYRHHFRVLGGYVAKTTANRLYLIGVLEGLRALKRPVAVTVHTRSGYLRDGLENWLEGWIRRGWQTREGGEVSNNREWRELAGYKKKLTINTATVSESQPPCQAQEAKEIARQIEQLQSS